MYKRNIKKRFVEAFRDAPVILMTGARQSGKSTLMKEIAESLGVQYETLDDLKVLHAARANPQEFIEHFPNPLILDEVQRVPELFIPIKFLVDQDRKPGTFALTGSANPLFVPKISESLAGRVELMRLWPLSQGELRGSVEGFIDLLFSKQFPLSTLPSCTQNELIKAIYQGGYPDLQTKKTEERRDAWCNSYLTTILQRDVQDLAQIEGLANLPNLLELLATQAANLLNVSELSRRSGIPNSTLQRYLRLLEALYLIQLMPSWHRNFGKKLVKSPKVHLGDTAIICHLLGISPERLVKKRELFGALLENFIAVELQKQATWCKTRVNLFHFRTQLGREVDILLERPSGELVGIEVKSSKTVSEEDFKGLKTLQEMVGDKFVRGVVLYTGDKALPFGKNLFALPVNALWEL